MTRRAAVRLTEEEDAVLRELSALRAESVSKIIGELIAAILPTWNDELKIRRKALTQEAKAAELADLASDHYANQIKRLKEKG